MTDEEHAQRRREMTFGQLIEAHAEQDEGIGDRLVRISNDSDSYYPAPDLTEKERAEENGKASGHTIRLVGDAMGLPPPTRGDPWGYVEQINNWGETHSSGEVTDALLRAREAARAEADPSGQRLTYGLND